ncbi:dicarboxylate/amino acid:cation symporter [Facklamia sp. DSM 111018]|uniref:Dicarboxylate/amino acid:cation symporter n=1 Tax=Facklamia lactis TaxID=2749967 RepID=A0ABS0LRY9_9LACT|nr:dicarboxylate/amino acid:cation symporter [Facklamia lactis]MBG9986930.1 dicarboxylate/amino acid:cation symporter [Facklamia lactis]
MKKISLTNQILIAMVVGMIVGSIIGPRIEPLKILGDIFLRLVQMSVVVMIMGAVIEAVGSLNPKELGKFGWKLAVWFMGGTFVASILGIAVGFLIKPGSSVTMEIPSNVELSPTTEISTYETILNFFPNNIVTSMTEGNMIQVIIFSILFGLGMSLLSVHTDLGTIKAGIHQFNQIIVQMVTMIMKMAPIGIFALLAWVTGTIGFEVMIPLGKFIFAMALATAVYLIIWIVLTATICKVNPILLAKKLTRMTVMAFTTTSSAITLPVKMEDQEKLLGVSKRVSGLVGPLGMAMNSNGLAIFLAIASITLSQFYGLEFGVKEAISTVLLSTLATLGTVAVPGGGLVALAIVIPSLNLPLESIGILAGIDWFSGMFRTVLNVDADATIAMILAQGEGELDHQLLNTPMDDIP